MSVNGNQKNFDWHTELLSMPGAIWRTTEKTGIRIFHNIMETAMSLRLKSLVLESQHCLLPQGWHVPLTSHNWVFIPSVWSVLWLPVSSVTQSCLTLRPHGLQCTRPPCPSPTSRVYSNSCAFSWWCHPTISSSVIPFSSRLQSFLASGSFQMSQLFTWGGQSIGVSASTSVLLMNTQEWSPLGWIGGIPLPSKELSRVFSNTTVQKHQFFCAQLSV